MKILGTLLLILMAGCATHNPHVDGARTDNNALYNAVLKTLTAACPRTDERTIRKVADQLASRCEGVKDKNKLHAKLTSLKSDFKKLGLDEVQTAEAVLQICAAVFPSGAEVQLGASAPPVAQEAVPVALGGNINTLKTTGPTAVRVSGNGTNRITLVGAGASTISPPLNGVTTITVLGVDGKTNVLTAFGSAIVEVTRDNTNRIVMPGEGTKMLTMDGPGDKTITLSGVVDDEPPRIESPAVFFLGGAKFQNPYSISVSGTTATLTNTGNSTVSFFGVAWAERYALVGVKEEEIEKGFFYPWLVRPDFEAQLGFVFGNSDINSTNVSASTLAGGGDFYVSAGFGIPFYRHKTATVRHQWTLEVNGGVSTDKQFELIHGSALLGLGYEVGYKADALSMATNVCGFLCLKFGAGWIDVPRVSSSGSSLAVAMEGGLPQFDHEWCPAASVAFLHPVSEGLYLFVAANIYSLRESYSDAKGPDQWNVSVGVSMKADAVWKKLAGLFN